MAGSSQTMLGAEVNTEILFLEMFEHGAGAESRFSNRGGTKVYVLDAAHIRPRSPLHWGQEPV